MALADTQSPVFIVGPGRSGTTMLLAILRNAETIFCARAETGYFQYLNIIRRHFQALPEAEWRHKIAAFIRHTVEHGFPLRSRQGWQPSDEELHRAPPVGRHVPFGNYGAAFRDVLDGLARESGSTRWAEKSPHHVYAITSIIEAIPNALIVEMVRDPRDVLASRKTLRDQIWTTDRYSPEVRIQRDLQRSYDPWLECLSWRQAVRAGSRGREARQERWLRIRYEDLVRESRPTVRELCKFLGISFDEKLLKVGRGIPGDIANRSNELGISGTSLGRWQNTLDDREVATCQVLCRREMRELSYEFVQTHTTAARVMSVGAIRATRDLVTRIRRQLRLGGIRLVLDSSRYRIRQFLLPSRSRGSR